MKKNIFLLLFVLFFSNISVLALDFDVSVDEEIKKKYNTQQIEYDLPSLPKVNSSSTSTQTTVSKSTTTVQAPSVVQADKTNSNKIHTWTKFKVVSNQTISDSLKENTNLVFTLNEEWYGKYIKLPKGTKLYGKVIKSHKPQITGNGGLIKVKITAISYNSKNYTMNAKVIKANSKKIFFNNIKGQRQYIASMKKQVDKGETFFNKTSKASSKLSNNPVLFIISPLPKIVGGVGYVACAVLSPVTAITGKGKSISIPSGKEFEIRLSEPSYIKIK